jgi:hypothetical protein
MGREVNSVYNIYAWVKSLPALSSINIHDSLLQKQTTKNQQLKQFDVGTLRGNALADFRRQKIGFCLPCSERGSLPLHYVQRKL